MDKYLILALDIGTSSVRASLYDSKANAIQGGFAKFERSFTVKPDGGAEMDPDAAFAEVAATIDAVLKTTSKLSGEIRYVAMCSFWHSLLGIDAKGQPTTKVFGWADTRSRRYSEALKRKFDEAATHNRTGARFHSSYWPAKLLWLRKEFPDVFAKTAKWLSFSDYVSLRVSDTDQTSVSMASGTGIFDISKCVWDDELISFLKLRPSNLPAIAEQDSTTFVLNKKFATRWPRLANARWFPAIGDGAADNIGAGCVTRESAALMIGTSGAMRVLYEGEPAKKIPSGLWCYRLDRKRVIGGGALSDGGNLYAWLNKNLKLPKDAEAQIANRKSGAHDLTFLPFLYGERSTLYRESATGAVFGLTSATDTIDILQAAFEAVAYRFAEILDQLNQVVTVKEIVASGGALRESPVWTQIIADVLGRDLEIKEATEPSSRGAVIFALKHIAAIIDVKIPTDGRRIRVDRDRFLSYNKARKRHADICKRLIR